MESPGPLLPLLDKLRDDPEEFVRRSVANNLNDIAKDNPDVVVEVCGRWLTDADANRTKLVTHALRSLIKAGHPGALELMGFAPPELVVVRFTAPSTSEVGASVELELELRSTCERDQKLVIDYALHFPGAKGRTNRKVFKWRTATLPGRKALETRKRHSFKTVSTRRTLPGRHRFELLVNGMSLAELELELE